MIKPLQMLLSFFLDFTWWEHWKVYCMNGHDRKGSAVASSGSGDFPNPFGDLNCPKHLETKLFWKKLALTARHFVHFTKWCGSSSLVPVLNEQQGPPWVLPSLKALWGSVSGSTKIVQVYIYFSCSLLVFLSLVSQKMTKEKNEPSPFLRYITPIMCRLQNMQISWSCHLFTTNNLKAWEGAASGWSWSLRSQFQGIWEETLHKQVWMISFFPR